MGPDEAHVNIIELLDNSTNVPLEFYQHWTEQWLEFIFLMKGTVIRLEVSPMEPCLGDHEKYQHEKWPQFIKLSQRQSIACNKSAHQKIVPYGIFRCNGSVVRV